MSLSWERDAQCDGVFGTERGNGRERVFRAADGSGASCWWLAPTGLPSRPSSSLQHGDQAGVALKYQAKGFMVAIMKGLMMGVVWPTGAVRE